MSKRNVSGLRKPPINPKEVEGFPHSLSTGHRFRAHNQNHGPWHFASIPSDSNHGGRFDLHEPQGTCYVADDIEAAVRERLGPRFAGHRWIPESKILQSTSVSRLDPIDRPSKGHLANTTAKMAARWVTREISTTLNYPLTQEWAAAFHAAGFVGVKYEPRMSTGSAAAEAWFAPAMSYELPYQNEPHWRSQLPIRKKTIRVRGAQVID